MIKKVKIKKIVEKIFDENANDNIPIYAVNQADSIANRFIYKLLQNTDDSFDKARKCKVYLMMN